jgi:hypothetical protein
MTELTVEQAAAEDELLQEIHEVLDRHYVTWRPFTDEPRTFADKPGVDVGEWYCGCGRTFDFSGDAVNHQTGEVTAIVTSRMAAAASDALIDAARELDRLDSIGTTRRDLVSDEDWEWFTDHPLQSAATNSMLSKTVPHFSTWLRDRAGDER